MTPPDPARNRFKRRKTLINPRIQLQLTGTFLGLTLIGLILQSQLFAQQLTVEIANTPAGAMTTATVMPLIVKTLGLALLWIVPMTLAVGILTTFRLAGPLYRLEQHLAAIERGEDPGECRLRKGDHLKEFCAQMNRSLDVARGRREPEARSGREPEARGSQAEDSRAA
ncbi:MAG: hypothetical protein AAFZ65_02135 [Planctomycetota bacterium]